jgi:hypothetical protein
MATKMGIHESRTIEQNLSAAERIAKRRSPANRRGRAQGLLDRRTGARPYLYAATKSDRPPANVTSSRKFREWSTRGVHAVERMGLHSLATSIGAAYHRHVKALAASSEATIGYGYGGKEDSSRDYYSKSWHNSYGPKRWKNAGARLTGLATKTSYGDSTEALPVGGVRALSVRLENHMGREVETLSLAKLPDGWRNRKQGALLDGEVLGVQNSSHVARYDVHFRKVGVAVPMPADLQGRFGQWEHGVTVKVCKAEIVRKRAVVIGEANEAKLQHRNARRLRLMTVLCANLRVTYQHARKAGLCDQGIRLYCARHGFSVEEGAPAGVLRATRDERASRAVEAAARELLASRGL